MKPGHLPCHAGRPYQMFTGKRAKRRPALATGTSGRAGSSFWSPRRKGRGARSHGQLENPASGCSPAWPSGAGKAGSGGCALPGCPLTLSVCWFGRSTQKAVLALMSCSAQAGCWRLCLSFFFASVRGQFQVSWFILTDVY